MERPKPQLLELPCLSAAQMREVARRLHAEYGILPLQTIETSGYALAHLAQQLLDHDIADRPVVVLAGQGCNGAGGLVAARYLLDQGAWVQIVLTHPPEEYTGLAAQPLAALQTMGAPLAWAEEGWELPPADLVIDALVGAGLRGEPQGKVRELIHLANSSVAPILSLDAPSGLDLNTGRLAAPHIHAMATLVLALPKMGLLHELGRSACGDLYLADMGVPPQLYDQLGLVVPPLFARDPIIALNVENGRAFVHTSLPRPAGTRLS